ncbi:hypothetical protein T07_6621 [Trichinella nelsoni]|uniref:Uncharacterized protein n=1 Tax=Trichinella nelsoni TaxID=6336 RepID=A0A0V0S4W7_9BILA|nr:hypothetical protein T07_6621 [Trichinella nelsoni]
MTQLPCENTKTYGDKLFSVIDVIPHGMPVTLKFEQYPPCAEENKTENKLSKHFINPFENIIFYRCFRQKRYWGNFLNATAFVARHFVRPAYKSVTKWLKAEDMTSTFQSKQPITMNNPEESFHKKWLFAQTTNNYTKIPNYLLPSEIVDDDAKASMKVISCLKLSAFPDVHLMSMVWKI